MRELRVVFLQKCRKNITNFQKRDKLNGRIPAEKCKRVSF